MNSPFSRRDFLKTATVSLAGLGLTGLPAVALEPFKRPGKPRLQLSLAAYSFRQFFKDTPEGRTAEAQAEKRIDLFQFINYCADHGCAGAELTSYYFPKQVDDPLLLRLRRHAFLRGIAISGTAVGNTFTHPKDDKRDAEIASVKTWIDHAAVLGAPHIRVFAGAPKGLDDSAARRQAIKSLEEVGAYAASKGVWLGVENHGGIVATPDGLLEIIKAVNSPAVGINLDTGNFHGADPYADLARCAPWAVNVQVKVEIKRAGAKDMEPADMKKIATLLREANYQGWVVLEYESKPDPFTAVPEHLRALREALG